MFFQRFYDPALAQASYMIGCQRTGNAVVVDANRDAEQYVRVAAAEELRITHVAETHIHADFVSGTRELAARTGAAMILSGEGGTEWRYGFAGDAGALVVGDGDHVMVGNIRLDVLHTPGHTPEHVSFLVTDTPANSGAWGILTGDFVFVGDVGRPDLLETAAGQVGTMETSARSLFHSLQRFRALPDHLQVWPGHGAGSACGKAIGAVPSTTVGYERRASWGLAITDEAEFVRAVLTGQPEPPRYFSVMKRINRDGPPVLGHMPHPARLAASAVDALVAHRETIVDVRSAEQFAAGHLPGTVNIPFTESFSTWAGWLLPYDRPLYLLVDDAASLDADRVARALAMIGLDRVDGVLGRDALDAWTADGRALQTVALSDPAWVAERLARGEVEVVDVRARTEWDTGHLPGARHIPLGFLSTRVAELPTDRPVVLQCETGTRSAIGVSVLQSLGITNAASLTGGLAAWRRAGLPVTA